MLVQLAALVCERELSLAGQQRCCVSLQWSHASARVRAMRDCWTAQLKVACVPAMHSQRHLLGCSCQCSVLSLAHLHATVAVAVAVVVVVLVVVVVVAAAAVAPVEVLLAQQRDFCGVFWSLHRRQMHEQHGW